MRVKTIFKERKEKLDLFQAFRKPEINLVRQEKTNMIACASCGQEISQLTLQQQLGVCPYCAHHHRLSAHERINQIFDANSFVEVYGNMQFKPSFLFAGYPEKLKKTQDATGLKDAIVCGVAKLNQQKVAVGIMDSQFMMGSMGSVVGEKLTRTIEYATNKHLPLLLFCCSGGARMQEGIVSLMQMAKTSSAIARFSSKGGLYISVLTDPTTGGVSASFANLGDIVLAEPKALIGFAGRRVIEKTINETLPKEFQTAEFLEAHGFIDRIVDRRQLRTELATLLHLHERRSR